jgi:SLT domain-containing protein
MQIVVCERGNNVEDNGKESSNSENNSSKATILERLEIKEHSTFTLEGKNERINNVAKKLTFHQETFRDFQARMRKRNS